MAKPKTSENMRIWEVLGKTDPAHTKQFTRAGGFKGTAVKPMWANKKMTELFGPCGIGWGQTEPQFQVIPALDEILVYCTAGIWYIDSESVSKTVHGVGGDKVVVKQSSGLRTDDEAFKKAYTDALSNAMKFIGVAADVHMGLFDDNKYVHDVRNEFEEQKKAEVYAEVERQKQQASNLGPVGSAMTGEEVRIAEEAKLAASRPYIVPPELDWSYTKGSGLLICKPMEVKKSKKKNGTGDVVTVKLNGSIDGNKNLAFYFHASNVDELMGCAGKMCKFIVIVKGDYANIEEVLEIDGKKVEKEADRGIETEARLLASTLDFSEEDIRELFTRYCGASWTLTLEKLKDEKSRRESESEADQPVGALDPNAVD